MKNLLNSELVLENPERRNNKVRFFADQTQFDLVGFILSYKDKDISMTGEDIDGNAEEFFHLDKFQVGCLIDFLSRIHADMDDIEL